MQIEIDCEDSLRALLNSSARSVRCAIASLLGFHDIHRITAWVAETWQDEGHFHILPGKYYCGSLRGRAASGPIVREIESLRNQCWRFGSGPSIDIKTESKRDEYRGNRPCPDRKIPWSIVGLPRFFPKSPHFAQTFWATGNMSDAWI